MADSRHLLRVIPGAFRVVRQVVRVLQVEPVRRHGQAVLAGDLEALVRDPAGVGEVAALQVDAGQLERGPQVHVEQLAGAGLLEGQRHLVHRLLGPAPPLVQQA
jgi:hypothetical protein